MYLNQRIFYTVVVIKIIFNIVILKDFSLIDITEVIESEERRARGAAAGGL